MGNIFVDISKIRNKFIYFIISRRNFNGKDNKAENVLFHSG